MHKRSKLQKEHHP